MEFLLAKLCSQHIKRIIFVTSLFAQLNRMESLQQSARDKLNYIMALASDQNALGLPARFQGAVWKNTGLHDVIESVLSGRKLTPEQTREISMCVVDLSPEWVRYSSKPAMADDVYHLITEACPLACD